MPQLDIYTYPGQIFWLAVSFIFLYFCMAKFVLPKLRSILQQRAFRRESDIEKATEFKHEAETILRDYEAELSAARAEATNLVESSRASIAKELSAKEAEASKNIQYRIEEAQDKADRRKAEGLKENEALKEELAEYIFSNVVRAA